MAPNRVLPSLGEVRGPFFLTGRDPEGWTVSLTQARARELVDQAERWPLSGVAPS